MGGWGAVSSCFCVMVAVLLLHLCPAYLGIVDAGVREQLRLGINPDCPHSQWSHYKDVDGKKVRTRTAAVSG